MYSVVLMMALSGGADATAFGHGCSGCSGSSCHGGGHGGLFRKHHGGCSGSACSGSVCNGSSCSGAVASCNGSGCNGCNGGHGLFRRHHNRCCGTAVTCTGSYGCAGSVDGCAGSVVPGTTVPVEPKKMPIPEPKKVSAPAPATLVVTLPAGARLTVDGNTTTSTSERRVLVTPALAQGEYSYTLRAEVEQDGQTVAQTQVVTVRPGQTTQVPFTFASSAVASR